MRKNSLIKLLFTLILVILIRVPAVFAVIQLSADGLSSNMEGNDIALSGSFAAVNSRNSVYIFRQTAEEVW